MPAQVIAITAKTATILITYAIIFGRKTSVVDDESLYTLAAPGSFPVGGVTETAHTEKICEKYAKILAKKRENFVFIKKFYQKNFAIVEIIAHEPNATIIAMRLYLIIVFALVTNSSLEKEKI